MHRADLEATDRRRQLLFANDKVKGRELRPATEYYLDAIRDVRANKERYAEAKRRHANRSHARPIIYGTADMAN